MAAVVGEADERSSAVTSMSGRESGGGPDVRGMAPQECGLCRGGHGRTRLNCADGMQWWWAAAWACEECAGAAMGRFPSVASNKLACSISTVRNSPAYLPP